MITDERLEELQRLADTATPGPWEWWTSNSWRRLSRKGGGDGDVLCPIVARDGHPDLAIKKRDMDFMENARTSVPELLAEVARLRAMVAKIGPAAVRLLSELEDCQDYFWREGLTGWADSCAEQIAAAKEDGICDALMEGVK